MSRVIAAYDLDEDHGRLWVNADLKCMPEIVIVANQPMDRAQTVTYVPEVRLLEALDKNNRVESENSQLRKLVRDVVLLAGINGCDVTKMQLHTHGGDWRTVWERMRGLGIEVE